MAYGRSSCAMTARYLNKSQDYVRSTLRLSSSDRGSTPLISTVMQKKPRRPPRLLHLCGHYRVRTCDLSRVKRTLWTS